MGRQTGNCAVAAIVVLFASLGLVAPASVVAAPPEFLARMGSVPGEAAGELDNPRGIAANPGTGRVYISDGENARIDEYTPWGLFVKSWGWGVVDGSAELQTCGPAEPEEVPDPSLCQKGSEGSGVGQFARPNGLAVDAAGDIYVVDRANLRVQKFSAAGEFELMFGGEVNKTTNADICTKADLEGGDVCGAGTSGEGPSHFAGAVGNYIAYGPAQNAIVVGDKDRIQVFNLDGTYREEISFEGPLASFAGKSVNALDVDGAGNIYFSLVGLKDVHKIGAAGQPLSPTFSVASPKGVTVDHEGDVYAIDDDPTPTVVPEVSIVKFDSTGTKLIPTKAEEEAEAHFPFIPFQGPRLNGIAANICAGNEDPGNLYISAFTGLATVASYVDAYGSAPIGCEPPPPKPPVIEAQYALAAGADSATVQAQINPRFWNDTAYYVEYGEGKCSEGGCGSKAPISPAPLTKQVTSKALKSAGVLLTGLEAGNVYHYRFVAESTGGGPVFGIDPDGGGPGNATLEAGLEATFRTMKAPLPADECPNDVFRKGASARLPDCRAYEMVSPLDKEGGDVALWQARQGVPALAIELHQSAPSGERFTYSSAFAFAAPKSAPYVSQYMAERTAAGWGSEAISPPRTESPVLLDSLFNNELQLFSSDLCRAWLRHYSTAPLTEGAIGRYANVYRRENCSAPPAYVALSTVEPPNRDPEEYSELFVQGASSDGTHAIFNTNDGLSLDAPALAGESELLLYESTPEGLRFVCYLPDGSPNPVPCGAGTAAGLPGGDTSSTRNAISADGERIFWTAYDAPDPGFGVAPGVPGSIYARIAGTQTIEVSSAVAPDPAWYWTAADDGSKAVFAIDEGPHENELYEFDVDAEEASPIAGEVEGPMGASEDASRIYFASKEDLDGAGPATAGDRNLYFYEAAPGGGGSFDFMMALAAADIRGSDPAPAPIEEIPAQRSAYVTADGLHATFTSVAPTPSGYDNRDRQSGERAQEVYRYDAVEKELLCVSCNPTGARPVGVSIGDFPAAARIQGWESLGHAPRVIAEDGSRLFFESHEALVVRDTNATWDVYQWEEPGKGSCDESDSSFSEETGGCVELLSSGESPAKSTFLDADPSGDNVFISTQSSLVGADYGLNDVYVARVGGGFPEDEPPVECEGEACQSPPAAPLAQKPASSAYRGPGNLPAADRKRRRCPRGKKRVRRAGKVRCVRRKATLGRAAR